MALLVGLEAGLEVGLGLSAMTFACFLVVERPSYPYGWAGRPCRSFVGQAFQPAVGLFRLEPVAVSRSLTL